MAPMTDTSTVPTPAAAGPADQPSVALTIAGSEATGGAGAQADLKTFQELGVFGSLALTCIVSFDPSADWGHRLFPVPQDVLREQLEAITAAHALDAVKIGMLGSPETIATTAEVLTALAPRHLVLDPVLICKGQEPGAALDTDEALKAKILPLATFVTPNHFESLSLAGMDEISTVEDLEEAARRIHETSGAVVLAKGGVRLAGPTPSTSSTTGPPSRCSPSPRSARSRWPGPAARWPPRSPRSWRRGPRPSRRPAPRRPSSPPASGAGSPRAPRSTPSGRAARPPNGERAAGPAAGSAPGPAVPHPARAGGFLDVSPDCLREGARTRETVVS